MSAGAVHVKLTAPSPAVPATAVGASGTVDGVTGEDTAEAGPWPFTFVAFTVNVYAVPLVNPDIVQLVAGTNAVQLWPALDVAV